MSRKKVFLALLAISSVILLQLYGGHFRILKSFQMDRTSLHPSSTLKNKHTSVAFLKTHKTGSSTMLNLLFRFAEHHNLTVALPFKDCGALFCYPFPFSSRFVDPHTLPAHIIANHMRLNISELRRMMPNDTMYITILREPVSMFESLFSYFSPICKSFQRVPNISLEAFLADPGRYYHPEETDSMFAHNTLTFDLGGDKDRPASDVNYMKRFIEGIEHVFSLVMIVEYFDESLVLLRHLLSWDLEDVVYLKMNMRASGSKHALGGRLPAQVRAWNSLDAQLYDHFNASLWQQLDALGRDYVAQEVSLLKRVQDQVLQGCFGGQLPQLRSAIHIKNKELRPWLPDSKLDILGYEVPANASRPVDGPGRVPSDLCLKLIMPELQYTSLLRQTQSLFYRLN